MSTDAEGSGAHAAGSGVWERHNPVRGIRGGLQRRRVAGALEGSVSELLHQGDAHPREGTAALPRLLLALGCCGLRCLLPERCLCHQQQWQHGQDPGWRKVSKACLPLFLNIQLVDSIILYRTFLSFFILYIICSI